MFNSFTNQNLEVGGGPLTSQVSTGIFYHWPLAVFRLALTLIPEKVHFG